MVLKKGTAFFEDFFKKIKEGIHDISNREAHQKVCGQRIQIVRCLGNAAADIWQIADDLFKQNQCCLLYTSRCFALLPISLRSSLSFMLIASFFGMYEL